MDYATPPLVLLPPFPPSLPAKWLLRNESRNSILTTRHYPDLGSTSDWLKNISLAAPPVTSITQIWVVRRRQYGISAFISQTSFNGETHDDVAKCRLFSQVTTVVIIVCFLGDERSEWREGKMQEIELTVSSIFVTIIPSASHTRAILLKGNLLGSVTFFWPIVASRPARTSLQHAFYSLQSANFSSINCKCHI